MSKKKISLGFLISIIILVSISFAVVNVDKSFDSFLLLDKVGFDNIRATNLTENSVTIVGTTNVAVECLVEYGVNEEFNHVSSDNEMMGMSHTEHLVTITGLEPGTVYDYRFIATLDDQEYYSKIKSFATSPSAAPVSKPVLEESSMSMENGNSESSMQDVVLDTNAPITMPMIDGYYNDEKVYFIHTEVSDSKMAQMMSMMVNFSTLYVPELTSIPEEEIANVYVFTNGIAGSGPYGGGPFFFQIDIFENIPGQDRYSQFRTPHLVTWSENSNPRLLTSVEDLFDAEKNGELEIQKTDLVVNAPMILWASNGVEQESSIVERIFESIPGMDGEIITADVENYLVTIKLHQENIMDMMK